jgi:hypothetical protein
MEPEAEKAVASISPKGGAPRESTEPVDTIDKADDTARSDTEALATAPKSDDPPPADLPDEDPSVSLRPTKISIGATALALTVVSALLFDPRATVGVAVGGLLATLNFILFIRLVGAFMSQKGNAAPWAVLAGVKLLGLFAVVYIILKRGDLPALSLAIGYGALPIGISLGSLFKPRPIQKLG